MKNVVDHLFRPVDIASIAFVRIFFGLLLFGNVISYLQNQFIRAVWIEPEYHFKYYGFSWVEVVPELYLNYIVLIVALSALFIAFGFLYRISCVLFFIGFSYLFLLDQALYLNHYYLVILVSFLLIFIPANRAFSVDSVLWPAIRSNHISRWCLWLLMFQIGAVYLFGGIAKINADWLHGWPIRIWVDDAGFINPQNKEFFVYLISYLGLLFDLLIVPLLLYPRTRIFGFILAVFFHSANKYLFDIGIFPLLSLTLTTLFFSPDWPRRIFRLKKIDTPNLETLSGYKGSGFQKLTVFLLAAYITVQIALPLRHFLYPGNVSWTEEGHKFAWHMKLRDKSGSIRYFIRDPESGKEWELNPSIYLTDRQRRKLSTRPNLMIQFALYLEEQFKQLGYKDVEVRTKGKVSLNGRKKQLIVDPHIDLTMHRESIMPADWILPLVQPLKKGARPE